MKSKRWLSASVYALLHVVVFLIGFLLVRSDGKVAPNVGASLMAAGIVGWVIFVYIFLSESRVERFEIISQFGFVSAFEARASRIKSEYDQRLNRAAKSIDIMGFGLRALWDDYHEQFPQWQGRANVRILLIDPSSPYADQRDKEEDDLPGNIRQSVLRFLRDTKTLRASAGRHRFQIRLYTCLPSVNIFRVDDDLFWGPYLVHEQSRNAPTFIVRNGGILFRRMTSQFDKIWQDDQLSRPVRQEDEGDVQ